MVERFRLRKVRGSRCRGVKSRRFRLPKGPPFHARARPQKNVRKDIRNRRCSSVLPHRSQMTCSVVAPSETRRRSPAQPARGQDNWPISIFARVGQRHPSRATSAASHARTRPAPAAQGRARSRTSDIGQRAALRDDTTERRRWGLARLPISCRFSPLTLPQSAHVEVPTAEASKQQQQPGQRQPHCRGTHRDHERIVEIIPPSVIHRVQHPEEIEPAPG